MKREMHVTEWVVEFPMASNGECMPSSWLCGSYIFFSCRREHVCAILDYIICKQASMHSWFVLNFTWFLALLDLIDAGNLYQDVSIFNLLLYNSSESICWGLLSDLGYACLFHELKHKMFKHPIIHRVVDEMSGRNVEPPLVLLVDLVFMRQE